MSRVFAYLRVSTEHQVKGDKNGIQSQIDSVYSWCDAHQVSQQSVIFARDEGVSGGASISARPALRQVLYELREGDTLLVSSLCRLSRDLMTGLLIEEEIERKKASLVSVKGEGTENNSPEAVLMRRMLQVFSSHERSLIKSRTRAALQSRKNRGLRTGTVPYGFQVAADGKKLIPVNNEVELMFEIEHLKEAGHSYQFICDELNHRGSLNRKGRKWVKSNLYYCLSGWMKDGKNRFYRLQNSSWV